MTEKLTYAPTPADAPEFTEDEQDSLAVAEKLGKEESELYAGKYQSAEELEEAYINLQKKLGSSDEDDEVEETTFDEDEYGYALDNGWIPLSWYYKKLHQMTWINARGSRLILPKFTFSKKQRKILNKKDITVKTFVKLDKNLRMSLCRYLLCQGHLIY